MSRRHRKRRGQTSVASAFFMLGILMYLNVKENGFSLNAEAMFIYQIAAALIGFLLLGALWKVISRYLCGKAHLQMGRIRNGFLVRKTFPEVDRMSGEAFEEFLKAHFERTGYSVECTPASGDYGVDLVCSKEGRKMAVQAKRYQGKVGVRAVQEVLGGMNYYGCDSGMVVTNSYFTPNAYELAKVSNIYLWDRDKTAAVFSIKEERKRKLAS